MSIDYGSIADAITSSGYVRLTNVTGTFAAGVALSANGVAYATSASLVDNREAAIWFHEKGFTEDGGARSWRLMGAYNTNVKGQIVINGVRPDSDDLQGGYAITFSGKYRDTRGVQSRDYLALDITSATGKKSCRVKGEEVAFEVSGDAAPTFWRMGALQVDLLFSGATR